jgi:hypothetical protein
VHGRGDLFTGLTAEPQELDFKVFETVDILDELQFNVDYNSGDGLGWGKLLCCIASIPAHPTLRIIRLDPQ